MLLQIAVLFMKIPLGYFKRYSNSNANGSICLALADQVSFSSNKVRYVVLDAQIDIVFLAETYIQTTPNVAHCSLLWHGNTHNTGLSRKRIYNFRNRVRLIEIYVCYHWPKRILNTWPRNTPSTPHSHFNHNTNSE